MTTDGTHRSTSVTSCAEQLAQPNPLPLSGTGAALSAGRGDTDKRLADQRQMDLHQNVRPLDGVELNSWQHILMPLSGGPERLILFPTIALDLSFFKKIDFFFLFRSGSFGWAEISALLLLLRLISLICLFQQISWSTLFGNLRGIFLLLTSFAVYVVRNGNGIVMCCDVYIMLYCHKCRHKWRFISILEIFYL